MFTWGCSKTVEFSTENLKRLRETINTSRRISVTFSFYLDATSTRVSYAFMVKKLIPRCKIFTIKMNSRGQVYNRMVRGGSMSCLALKSKLGLQSFCKNYSCDVGLNLLNGCWINEALSILLASVSGFIFSVGNSRKSAVEIFDWNRTLLGKALFCLDTSFFGSLIMLWKRIESAVVFLNLSIKKYGHGH